MTRGTQPRICCRQIRDVDVAGVIELLAKGFPNRTQAYWTRALRQLARRETPESYPRFGYVLEADGALVGVILLIFSARYERGQKHVRCNGSGWYVEPKYRSYASLLLATAVRQKDVTHTNFSPRINTLPIIEAQGFTRYSFGQIVAFPALSLCGWRARAYPFNVDRDYGPTLTADERRILAAHADYGCLAYVVVENGEATPFVFLPRRTLNRTLPTLQLIYCRDVGDVARCAGAIGREILKRGILFVCLDATAPMPGLTGKYFADRGGRRYFKGPERPRIGDLTYSEMVLFGP